MRALGYVQVGVWTQPRPKPRPGIVGHAALLPETLRPPGCPLDFPRGLMLTVPPSCQAPEVGMGQGLG